MKYRQFIWALWLAFNGHDLTISNSLMVLSFIKVRLIKGFQND